MSVCCGREWVQLIRICPRSSLCWQGKMEGSQKAERASQPVFRDSHGLGCQCRADGGDFRTLSPGARGGRPGAHPHPRGRGFTPGPCYDWRERAGDDDGWREAPPPPPRPSRARRPLGSLALARVAPPRRVRASVGPECGCGATGCRQRGARPGGGDRVAGGASEPGDSHNAMAPIGLKAVVGESKWHRGSAR